jgi:hypothetical protein
MTCVCMLAVSHNVSLLKTSVDAWDKMPMWFIGIRRRGQKTHEKYNLFLN